MVLHRARDTDFRIAFNPLFSVLLNLSATIAA
jgi:hypothetical protein